MDGFSLIANSGIQLLTFKLKLNTQDKFKMWFREWYDTSNGQWRLDLAHEITTEDNVLFYDKHDLFDGGYLNDPTIEFDPVELRNDGINPLRIDDEMCANVRGELYKLTFSDKHNAIKCFENKWLPIPYFFKRTEKRFKFSPMNWSRVKFVPVETNKTEVEYDVILAFDTRAGYVSDKYNEFPVFPDQYCSEMNFSLCDNEFFLMDYCSPKENWSYIDEYIFKLVHPTLSNVSQIKGANAHKMSYIASYIFLINYLAQNKLFPTVKLYKDQDVEVRNVDMVIDIGNSKTTALLIEDNSNFNQVKPLSLIDYTELLHEKDGKTCIRSYKEPFDMRLAFRKVDFGSFGINDSKQFVFPSFIRLGQEASTLIHRACSTTWDEETLSTYSSPKRYLWDGKPSKKEWEFLVLPGEEMDHILNIKGISSNLMSDGRIDVTGSNGGRTSHYSRRSLMTFAFLEMLSQANTQINSEPYRTDVGWKTIPRKIKRIIVTCPTAMSKIEREALVKCTKDAVTLYGKFMYNNNLPAIDIIPAVRSMKDNDGSWYYDEATCAQLVYIYGEVGHKYKGVCSEFFNLYGKITDGNEQPTLTVGSLDIGAGTSDLMISEYSYTKGDLTTITPDPKFYDSFYFAGDDMLKALVKNVMLLDEKHSAFRKALRNLDAIQYRQKIKNFFGPDYNGQTIADRIARRDFNIQYSVPLMTYFLQLASNDSCSCVVKYEDVFKKNHPNTRVVDDFKKRMGIDITTLSWEYNKEFVADIISKEFEPLLKKIAAMFFAYSCDVILLSGRPSSLPAIRNIFLKYYPVSPNRLITLNNYYVGDWYPFCQNTGYITNPKTIVAMGGVIGHYASEYSNLDKFSINLEKLKNNLKSTVNYIEASRDGQPIEYLITPDKMQGELTVSRIPDILNVRQFGLATYPSRALYSIDFNYMKLVNKIRNKALDNGENPSDAAVQSMANEEIEAFKKRMPFKITIDRDPEDKENLTISAIEDRNGAELSDSSIEIHIQSLGVDDQYWLDSGAFDF
ncbi:MAG: virulence factor SrfB [Paludibacteraceae bacterium]|nr:virulence factor SrfB [Paludibacteraceae bacterium]